MRSWTIPAALVAVLVPAAARADQCQLVDADVAARAVAALANHPKVIQFCEPCGDKAPGEVAVASRVEKERDTSGDYQIVIDRREVDLAYTYVQTGPNKFENVAELAGCPTSGVSPSLKVDDATPTGVLITADATPVQVAAPPPPPPPAPPPTITYVYEQASLDWLPILLACSATSGLWMLGTLLLVRRRRIAMRPRAVALVDRNQRER
jgi:hypothetical protein